MLLSEVLQSRGAWRFDIRSAIIGAILAWIVVGALYSQRTVVRRLVHSLWEPVAAWRRRQRASQAEKYATALQETLRRLLLLEPALPDLVLRSPAYQALAPLPASVAEATLAPRTLSVPQSALLAGHPKLVLTGTQGTGRTAALIVTARELMSMDHVKTDGRPPRLPVWIDLAYLPQMKNKRRATAADRLVELATAFLPAVLPSWLAQRLRREPCVVLIDNWEMLAQDQRVQVAGWIRDASGSFDDVAWIVASAPEGFGTLVEEGFVPIELGTRMDRARASGLYRAWRELLAKSAPPSDDDVPDAILMAADAGAPLWELHLRSFVHLETEELPERPVEVVDRALQLKMEAVDLGRMPEDAAAQARETALLAMVKFAVAQRLEGQTISDQALHSIIATSMPPKPDHARRLEAAVHKLLTASGLLRAEGKDWRVAHKIWADYLVAIHLAESEEGNVTVEAHLNDPTWDVLTEFYAGIADVGAMVQTLANQAAVEVDERPLLRAARWGVSADPEQPWRKALNKVLAQALMRETLDTESRLALTHALALVAGDGARAFFVRMLVQASPGLRAASLRGLGWCGEIRDMAVLAAALRDQDRNIRESAVRALHDLGTPGAIAYLVESLPQVDEELMPVIAEALAASPEGGRALDEAVRHPDLLVRRAAALGLGHVNDTWARERLLEIAREDAEWLVRSAAETALQAHDEHAHHLVRIPPPPQPDRLDWLIGWAARQGTGLGVGEAAVAMLVRAAQEGNVDAKVLSALTLAQIGRENDLRVLTPLMGNPDPGVSQTAAWATQKIRQRYRLAEMPVTPSD